MDTSSEPGAADGGLKIATDAIDCVAPVVVVLGVTGVGAEAGAAVVAGLTSFGLSRFVIIFDSSFLGASAAPFDADDADFVTVKLSVFLVASLVTPDAAVAPDFAVDEAAVDVTFDEVAEEVLLLTGGLD